MPIVDSLLSVGSNDVFKLLQLVGGDPLSITLATLQGAAGVAKAKAWFSLRSQKRSEQRMTQGDSDEAAKKILAGALRVDASAVPQHATRHLLLILQAFGEAWARSLRSLPDGTAAREKDVTEQFATVLTWRWQAAFAEGPIEGPAQLVSIARLSSEDPLRSPYYQALWQTLTDNSFDPPLFPQQFKLLFEQNFRLAYSTALASQTGADVRAYLRSLAAERPQLLRSLLVSDLAGWGARQVFGNAMQPDPDLPDLPLETLYVEPMATWWDGQEETLPALTLLHRILLQSPIVAVSAPMGLGKSLTARTLAAAQAKEWLSSSQATSEIWLPIFVRCADALDAQNVQNLPQAIQRAQQLHCRQLGFDLTLDDPALAPPSAGQKVLYVLDGLDEVVLTESQVRDFFLHLDQKRSSDVRYLVLSRPQTLEILRRGEQHGPKIPVVTLEPFSVDGDGCQAAAWLDRWNQRVRRPANKVPILWPQVKQRRLDELAATPILLFMIAETWDELPAERVNHATLYEQFFQQLARGKHERDQGAEHRHIREASGLLLRRLIERRFLPTDAKEPAAMLWLMGRIAWKHYCLEQRREELFRHHVVMLLRDELRLKDASETTYQTVASGLMLALQADRLSEDPAILFGHKSFREFLVARYWQGQMRRVIGTSPQSDPGLWEPLLEGRLLGREDRSVEFLFDLIIPEAEKGTSHSDIPPLVRQLVEWARQQFADTSQIFTPLQDLDDGAHQKYPDSLLHERRAVLREAALAIGCAVALRTGLPPIEAEDPFSLRSLIAWFWATGRHPIIRAPGLVHPRAMLDGADLEGANLERAQLPNAELLGARLSGASLQYADLRNVTLEDADLSETFMMNANLQEALLSRASLREARLQGANLSEADLEGADLRGANLQRAILRKAALQWARLADAYLQGADLKGANLDKANLDGAHLQRAQIEGAYLQGSSFQRAYLLEANLVRGRLQKANLQGAQLQRANLRKANLRQASLQGANLKGANLKGANLEGANLEGANLEGANLEGANLEGANFEGANLEGTGLDGTPPRVSPSHADTEEDVTLVGEDTGEADGT